MIIYQGATWDVDMLQLTDAAIQMMSRHLPRMASKWARRENDHPARARREGPQHLHPVCLPHGHLPELEAQMGDGTASMYPPRIARRRSHGAGSKAHYSSR